MKPAEYCKKFNIKNLQELGELSGFKSRTLSDWWHTNNKGFKTVVQGASIQKKLNK